MYTDTHCKVVLKGLVSDMKPFTTNDHCGVCCPFY